jgi:hypothetical protein
MSAGDGRKSPLGADDDLEGLAALLRERNRIDARIGDLLGRPMTSGHAGEWIAAKIFDIQLEASASAAAIDGRFRAEPLAGKSVNVKWYLKREGLLDMTPSPDLDYYLVFTGPNAKAGDLKGLRPWVISSVYLFDAQELQAEQMERGVKVGIASSVTQRQWVSAEIYPNATNGRLNLTDTQRRQLALFA